MGSRVEPVVSIAMATYNGAPHLPAQLASLAAQTVLPRELVVSDDGSADATLAILHEFAAGAPFPVAVHRNPARLGYGRNFLRAAGLCGGALIAFCDQDDVWRPDKIALCTALLAAPQVLLLLHSAALIGPDGGPLAGRYPDYRGERDLPAHLFLLWDFGFSGCTMVARRELVETGALISASDAALAEAELGAPGTALAHDRWLYFLASAMGVMRFSGRSLIDYRRHPQNTSRLAAPGGGRALARLCGRLRGGAGRRAAALAAARRLGLAAAARGRLLGRNQAAFPAPPPAAGYRWLARLLVLKYLILKRRGPARLALLGRQCFAGARPPGVARRHALAIRGQSAFYCFLP
jgi:hypothetical protein